MSEQRQWWIFTFGCGQKYQNRFVKIYGTFDEARRTMFDKYGEEWAFQYTEEDWIDWEKRRPAYLPVEQCMEKLYAYNVNEVAE